MRVLILAQYYDPVPIPKPGEVARWLHAHGHEVSVLTGLPNYPDGVLAQGYRLVPYMREMRDGIRVRRAFEIPYHGTSSRGRILNYTSFMVSGSAAVSLISRPDVVYVWHPPLTVGVIASVMERLRGVPFVYDVQDIWPDSALMSGMLSEGRTTRLLRALEIWAYRRAAHVLVVTEGARDNLIGKGVSPSKVSVLPHWAHPSYFTEPTVEARSQARRFLDADDKFIVTFAGNLGLLQGLDVVLAAAQRVSSPRVAFRFVGDGSDKRRLERIADERGLSNVRFLGPRPSTEMPAILTQSDLLLVQLRGGPLSELIVPSKTQAYLAAGRPLVAALDGPAAQIIREADAGRVARPDDPAQLADVIDELAETPRERLSEMGQNGRDYARRHFQRDDVMRSIEEHLRSAQRTVSRT